MPRLTFSLPDTMHSCISSLATCRNESMSDIINQLIQVGLYQWGNGQSGSEQQLERHCQQLIIQMNALIKNISVELLRFNREDFEQLQQAAMQKLQELI